MRIANRADKTTILAGRGFVGHVAKLGAPLSCMLLVVVLGGCGDAQSDSNLIPVVGKVTIDGQPVTTPGSVSFRDASGMVQPTAKIEEDGTYTLIHNREEGAPPGMYRVVVFVWEPQAETAKHGGLPRLIINPRFTNPSTTPLQIEVRADAPEGHYDLEVTR